MKTDTRLHEALIDLLRRHVLPGVGGRGCVGGGGGGEVSVEGATRLGAEDDDVDLDDVGAPVVVAARPAEMHRYVAIYRVILN